MRWLSLLLALLFVTPAFGDAVTEPAAEAPSETPEAQPAAQDSKAAAREAAAQLVDPELLATIEAIPVEDDGHVFLWKVTSRKKRHKGSAWLFGSIHLGKPSLYPLPAAVEAAFDASDALVVEVDLFAEGVQGRMAAETMKAAMMTDGRTLSDLLDEERMTRLSTALQAHGLPMMMVGSMRPMLVGMTLSLLEMTAAGWDPALGIDKYFLDRARGSKDIVELETAESQLKLITDMPIPVQVAVLQASIDAFGASAAWADKAWQAIRAGDDGALLALAATEGGEANVEEYEQYESALLGDRNKGMAARIAEHVRSGEGTWFVVVGALHVPGDEGLVGLLGAERGFRVEQQTEAE